MASHLCDCVRRKSPLASPPASAPPPTHPSPPRHTRVAGRLRAAPASQAASVPASPPAPAPRSPPRRPRAAIQRQIHLAGASQPEAEADPPRSSSEPCFSSDATLSSFSQPHASKEMASTRGDGFDAWGSQPPLSELSDLDLNSTCMFE
ncbi:vegetative cell wall protein gp1-like [Sorghum bicolor]|uniref:vegetative cell wall protein gp1-like n=1 Tax=Sorghum bicolor TaxID=4558 RepID=UPI000B42425D|nr:vegetative cell wall protein gp1-like [Sorghum bicolor]|eukprot:XP_021308284.1 vegetative cell wall protein gp1-like [Sorghum bicolor]